MNDVFTKVIPKEETIKEKEFHPGEHVIFRRTSLRMPSYEILNKDFALGGKLEVPEGYQIMSFKTETIETTETNFRTFDNVCVDIWFINNKRVKVTPTFNCILGRYDYSAPGTIVETMVDEPAPKLTFTPEKK